MSEQHIPSQDDLYGGFFDIARGEEAKIDLSGVKAALLLYDKLVVPDNFFSTKGALANQLLSEITSPGSLTVLLKQGLIVPALRKGESLRETWLLGPSIGIDPGHFLTLPKKIGDKLFDAISDFSPHYVKWPVDMAEAKTDRFGRIFLEKVVNSDDIIGDTRELSKKISNHFSSAIETFDVRRAEILIEDFIDEIRQNYQSTKFRRGMIEKRLAKSLDWKDDKGNPKFDYNRAWNEVGISGRVLRGLIRITSTAYEYYQATEFSTSAAFVDHRDPVAILDFKSDDAVRNGYASTFSVELFPLVNFDALSFEKIAALRARFRADTFAELRARRSSFISAPSPENFEALYSFANGPVLEMIKRDSPESVRRPTKRTVTGASLLLTTGASASSVIGVMPDTYVAITAGAVGVGVAKVDSFASWLGLADSISGWAGKILGGVDSGLSFFDRAIVQSPAKRKLANRLVRELTVSDTDAEY